jgi:hypothetical protein
MKLTGRRKEHTSNRRVAVELVIDWPAPRRILFASNRFDWIEPHDATSRRGDGRDGGGDQE